MAWILLTKSVLHALDYDAKLISAEHLQCVAKPLYDAVDVALDKIVGVKLAPDSKRQLRLPGCFGGCGARRLALSPHADAAYWSMWSEHSAKIQRLCGELGKEVDMVIDTAHAQAARQRLESAGVTCDGSNHLSFTAVGAAAYENSAWHMDLHVDEVMQPTDSDPEAKHWQIEGIGNMRRVKYLSRLLRGVDALDAARLWEESDRKRRTALLSAGGPGTGTIWQIPPREHELFENAHFRAAIALRVGAIRVEAGTHCHYQRTMREGR